MTDRELHSAAAGLDPIARIEAESMALADAAAGNLDAPVEYCPGWLVGDLVWHVLEVQAFWRDIVERRLADPADVVRPADPPDSELVDEFRAGAHALVSTLRKADPMAAVWTWAPQQDAAFVIRHQVQEAAVHRWDAEHAAGHTFAVDRAAAVDSIEEFLTFSTRAADAAPLQAAILITAADAQAAWIVEDGPETALHWRRVDPPAAAAASVELRANASDLLLWLYARLATSEVATGDVAILERFRSHLATD